MNYYDNIPLHKSCEKSYENVAKCLIKFGADINKNNRDKETSLFVLVKVKMKIE